MKLRSLLFIAAVGMAVVANAETLRPPAVPLVACDPYFSIWSPADKLTDVDTTHWTGKPNRLTSLVRIDGKPFRLMGATPTNVPALPQTNLELLPTRTIYTFAGEGIRLTLTFMTADLPDDLDVLSRPVTYLTWKAQATDAQKHTVSVYFDARSEIAVNQPDQPVTFQNADVSGIKAWRVGSVEQPILKRKGDDVRIDWGYFYVAMAKDKRADSTINSAQTARDDFVASGRLVGPAAEASLQNNGRNDSVIAFTVNLGTVQAKAVSCWLMLAYDDLYSIQYMKKNLRPYWRRNGWEAADLLKASAKDYASLLKRCVAFDDELMADLRNAGGENYAQLGALAYRQCFAAGKFVADDKGQPLQFCKENHSNGCISTSDVFYPMSPQFLLFSPTLAKSFIVPFMNYAASDRWKFPFAPHDLGTYPQANGQVYGGGERTVNNQMPVEESGNLLCIFGAVAQMEGNANFAGLYWKQLEQWAGYLKEKGFDPENQLCTDDFAGHLAHNVNLSAKAICGLGSFAKLCALRGDQARADEYFKLAREFAQRWVKEADDGDHLRLAFDRPETWSQKYNMVWDRILGLNLFPAEVKQKEMDYYKKVQNNQYGLPLDNRKTYTKLDWITWTATLTQNRADFEALIAPVIAFLNATPDRSPMTDWYQTKTARKVGFTARPVVGGVFLQMLYNKAVWQKYARRDKTKAKNWAPMPKPPAVTVIVPAADKQAAAWNYTTTAPAGDWMDQHFNDSSWKQGQSGFGTSDTPGAIIGTTWRTDDIWLRREMDMPAGNFDNVSAWLHHDEDTEVYINGLLALKASGFNSDYDVFPLTPEGRAALKPGKNLIAMHCHQTNGGQYVDFGLVKVQTN
ncbi:MAG TPA: glutaminase [Verrucomicrobia subdivision 3 bacterium]|nr:glutaminase [Limisphaerales bacterium]